MTWRQGGSSQDWYRAEVSGDMQSSHMNMAYSRVKMSFGEGVYLGLGAQSIIYN